MSSNPSFGSQKRVRMRDVASRCGVSISTVSLVLSGDSRIPEDTTRKVLQAVKALEYRPSVVARNLARRSSRTIGVILPEWALSRNQAFYFQAIAGIHSQTQPAGYKIVVEAANPSFLERRYYHRLLKEQSADAMIYMAANLNDSFLGDMTTEPYPFVLLGGLAHNVDLPAIDGHEVEGAKMATQHLLSLGHKKIGFVAGLSTVSHGQNREKGYREAMSAAGAPIEPGWIVAGDFDTKMAEEATKKLVDQNVSAIFAASDSMAIGVLRALQKAGRAVPTDIAVVGMDDLVMSEWMSPALTTVRYDIAEFGAVAAKFVINRIKSPVIQKDMLEKIPSPQLIVRSSCGAKK